MEYAIALTAIIIVILIALSFLSGKKQTGGDEPVVFTPTNDYKPCPVCHKGLKRGERVHSTIFKGNDDNIMHIYGCPYCYQKHPGGGGRFSDENKRRCPVCKKELPQETMIYARVFEKPGKTHVHVLGCPSCRRKK